MLLSRGNMGCCQARLFGNILELGDRRHGWSFGLSHSKSEGKPDGEGQNTGYGYRSVVRIRFVKSHAVPSGHPRSQATKIIARGNNTEYNREQAASHMSKLSTSR